MSSKAEVLQQARLKTMPVPLANGLTLTIREFSGLVRDEYETSMLKVVDGKRETDLSNMRGKLVAASVVDDETGELMFTPEEAGALPASLLEPLVVAARQLNGLNADAVEDATKNSDGAPSAVSTSA